MKRFAMILVYKWLIGYIKLTMRKVKKEIRISATRIYEYDRIIRYKPGVDVEYYAKKIESERDHIKQYTILMNSLQEKLEKNTEGLNKII